MTAALRNAAGMFVHGSIAVERDARLAAELERRRALSAETGDDHVTEWLRGVNDGHNPKDQRQGRLA